MNIKRCMVLVALGSISVNSIALNIKPYCNYKYSANHISLYLPVELKYKDGFIARKNIFINCTRGIWCNGFVASDDSNGTYVMTKIESRHMGKDSVILVDGINEFLLDVTNNSFIWTENSLFGNGGTAIYKCQKINSE